MSTSHPDSLPDTVGAMFSRRWDRSYASAKLRTDALYPGVFASLGDSSLPLLDIGCGLGLLAFYLRARGFRPAIVGLDYDHRKISQASHVAAAHGIPDIAFQQHDAREGLPRHSGNVAMLDILQFFNPKERRDLLRSATSRLAPGGLLVIRSGLRDRSWRYRITVAGDYLARATRWMSSAPVDYPSRAELAQSLAPLGELTIAPLWGRTPFNNYLLVLRRGS